MQVRRRGSCVVIVNSRFISQSCAHFTFIHSTNPLRDTGSITNVTLSAKYGIVVSVCSHNRAALLWDLNRRRLVRQLALATTGKAATNAGNDLVTVSIDEATGTIVLTAGTTIHAYDANGSPLATLDVSSLPLRESMAATGGADASTSASWAGGMVGSAVNVLTAPATPISACCVVGDGCVLCLLPVVYFSPSCGQHQV